MNKSVNKRRAVNQYRRSASTTHSALIPIFVSSMAVLGNVLGFGAFGVAARAWQLGIQKRPLFQSTYLSVPFPQLPL
jgi:hypothetical protein